MRRGKRSAIGALWLLALSGSCFRTTAPSSYLPTAAEATRDAYGGWIRVQNRDDTQVEGELLAATVDTLHVLSFGGWLAMPVAQVRVATLTAFRVPLDGIIIWGALGGLSTISHGFVLILTAPTWIVASSLAGASASKAPRVRSVDPAKLAPFARFPQGLPPDIDRAATRGKYSTEP